jgi:hypothetical protein
LKKPGSPHALPCSVELESDVFYDLVLAPEEITNLCDLSTVLALREVAVADLDHLLALLRQRQLNRQAFGDSMRQLHFST